MDIMGDPPQNLEDLPTEIVQRIALFLPCSSILRLSSTSRALHEKCYDKLVFKRSATTEFFLEHDPAHMRLDDVDVEPWELESCASEASAECSEDEEWWPDLDEDEINLPPGEDWDYDEWAKSTPKWTGEAEAWYANWPVKGVLEGLDVGGWAKIAFAVEKAREVIVEREEAFDEGEEERLKKEDTERYTEDWEKYDMKSWLPHLLAVRHPAVFALPGPCLQMKLWRPDIEEDDGYMECLRNPSLHDDIAVAFSMAVLHLHRMELNPAHANSLIAADEVGKSLWHFHPGNMGMLDILISRVTGWQWSWEPPRHFDFSDVYALLLHMMYTLDPHRTVTRISAPVLHRMPVWEVLGRPMPFTSAVEDLVQNQLSAEEMVQYLTGEWVGFNTTNGEDDRYVPLDIQLLSHIKLSARSPSSADLVDPGTLAIIDPSLSSKDKSGTVRLNGSVSSTGVLIMSEVYGGRRTRSGASASTSRFRGVATPFGIVGLCEDAEARKSGASSKLRRGFYGNFWIWKKEWCL